MFEKAKKYLDRRDRRHTITDIFLAFWFALSFAITAFPKETIEILKHFGVIPPLATIIVAFLGVMARRYYSPQVLETHTMTATTTIEATEPMQETLSPDTTTNDTTNTPTVQG